MIYDLYVTFPCTSDHDVADLVDNKKLDIATRIQLLAPALTTWAKDIARTGDRRKGGGYKSLVLDDDPAKTPFARELIEKAQQQMQSIGLLIPSPPDFATLPPYAAFIQFTFTLAKPYISRDDEPFHISDNPVRKDKVFKVPMVAPSGWKGALRAALWQKLGKEEFEQDGRIKRLFGEIRNDTTGHAGALHFYPTFFDKIGLEVINPHTRETGVGKWPIYFECVPVGAEGTFSLLYAPLPGTVSDEEQEKQAREDLVTVARAVKAMLLTYGFSAKKSSGYGEAQDEIEGTIHTTKGNYQLTSLAKLAEEARHVTWS